MADDPDTMRARLDRLANLVELARWSQSDEDRARMERSIQLVSGALQTVARARQRSGDAARQSETLEIEALCRLIVEEARAAGLRIPGKAKRTYGLFKEQTRTAI